LVETVKGLQKNVQIYKYDNEKLMKYKQKDDFNIKMMQILDIIQKKMDREIESSKSRNHKSHGKRKETRSVDRNHHHSPKHSFRKLGNSSRPFPVKKNKRRTRGYRGK
jgi:hypothetical protein